MHSFSQNMPGQTTLHLALCAGWGGGGLAGVLYIPAGKITACRNPETTCRKISEGAATLKQVAGKNNCPLPHEKVRLSASGSSFTVYATEIPNGPLTEKQLQIPRGKIVSKTIKELLSLLKPENEEQKLYGYAQNTGTQKGTLTITYYPQQE